MCKILEELIYDSVVENAGFDYAELVVHAFEHHDKKPENQGDGEDAEQDAEKCIKPAEGGDLDHFCQEFAHPEQKEYGEDDND